MGDLKNDFENIVKGIKEVHEELWKQRERLGSLMIAVGNLSAKAERIEDENIKLKKELEDQGKELDKITKEKDALVKQQK